MYLDEGDESLNADVLYRPGETHQGEPCFTPRLIICDLKGSLGSLRPVGELYESEEESRRIVSWEGDVQSIHREANAKNEFLRALDDPNSYGIRKSFSSSLSKDVRVWSDFNAVYYNPHTITQLSSHQHMDEGSPFELFITGRDAYKELELRDRIMEDQVRKFMEETDNAQGFQVIVNTFDGFGGLAVSLLEDLQQEYSKKARIVFGLNGDTNSNDVQQQLVYDANQSICLRELNSIATMYIPMRHPTRSQIIAGHNNSQSWASLVQPFNNVYEWSGYLAAAVDTVTLPFRLKSSYLDMHDMSALMNPKCDSALTGMSFALPFPLPVNRQTSLESLLRTDGQKFNYGYDLTLQTGFDDMDRNSRCSFSVIRGASQVIANQTCNKDELPLTTTQVNEKLNTFIRSNGPMFCKSMVVEKPYLLTASFPQLFSSRCTTNGLVQDIKGDVKASEVAVTQCAAYTRLYSGPALAKLVDDALNNLSKARRNQKFIACIAQGQFGISNSDLAQTSEELLELKESFAN